MEYSAKNFMSPTYNNKLNKLTSPNKINNYLKNDSYIDNPEYNLILPSINQKSNLSNSGRNIVLTNLNCNFSDEEHKFSKIKNNSALNYGNFNIFSDNSNLTVPSQEKEKLDYELSKLEEQYKDIINKFSILSKKRDLMN